MDWQLPDIDKMTTNTILPSTLSIIFVIFRIWSKYVG